MVLQSSTREAIKWLVLSSLATRSTMDLASTSISTASRFMLIQRFSQSLRAQISAIRLVVVPMFLKKPRLPWSSSFLITPPPPDVLGFPKEALLVLSLYQFCRVFYRLSWTDPRSWSFRFLSTVAAFNCPVHNLFMDGNNVGFVLKNHRISVLP